MKITGITVQVKTPSRVNVNVDGKYRFSLDVFQVGELGVRVGREYSETELVELETESQFGKLYTRALEYTMLRPHSAKEIRDYLYRKTLTKKSLKRSAPRLRGRPPHEPGTDTRPNLVEIPGVSKEIADRVYERLVEKKYIDDEKFARFWVEHRNIAKGTSLRKLTAELRAKGLDAAVIEQALSASGRSNADELAKIIAKKRARYADDQKFMQYLARQGFGYDDIKQALADEE